MKGCPNKACVEKNAGVETDYGKGDTYCMGCGRVLEENATVNEVTFAEGNQGQPLLVGQHVGTDGKVYTGVRLPGEARDEAASFLKHGRQDINTLKTALGLRRRHAEEAVSLFKIALQRNFVKGRRIIYVSCACLYAVCRMEKSAHMLIDFSEVLKVNVFKIGAVFLQLVRLTNIRLHLVDPSLYIHRFVGQLNFEHETPKVANTALRLIARMKRDWLVQGRRPSGLCGAAIIIACRVHNFFRSKDEIVRVVRVSPQTVQERLFEFRDTASAYMTGEELELGGGDDGNIASLNDLETKKAEDPPCVKKKRKLLSLRKLREGVLAKDVARRKAREASVREQETEDESSEGEHGGEASSRGADEEARVVSKTLLSLKDSRLLKLGSVEHATRGADAGAAGNTSDAGSEEDEREKRGSSGSDREMQEEGGEGESDIDDEELEQYLNSEQEVVLKTKIWESANWDFIERQKAMEKLQKENPAEFRKKYPWKVQGYRKRSRLEEKSEPADAAEAAEQALRISRSSKINYDILNNMLGDQPDDMDEAKEGTPMSSVTPQDPYTM